MLRTSLALILLSTAAAQAAVTLPALLTDHMIVQRGIPVHIWGKAAPGEDVTVTFHGDTKSTKANALGQWGVHLAPVEAGGPFDITIKGTNEIKLQDVLVGDVWVASGQSNMEFRLAQAANAQTEIANAKYPKIRRFKVEHKVSEFPMDDVTGKPWVELTPETAPQVSAVAYFFARNLFETKGIPQGIIDSSWGGTPVEAWTSYRALSSDPALMPAFAEWAASMEAYPTNKAKYDLALAAWTEAAAKAQASGAKAPNKPALAGQIPGGPWEPAGLYNGMIAPLVPFGIKGALWYQGESNANPTRAPLYAREFQAMIRDWRKAWGEGDFPFLFVQLANYKANVQWPDIREAQRQTLSLANTGMAVTIDVGNPTDIHPTNKQDVGLRLALAARATVYGEKIEYSGPTLRAAARDGSSLRVWFDHAAGLTAKGGGDLKGFEIAGANKQFVAAQAKIDGTTIVVSSPSVPEPAFVRYAWADNPDCNLYNAAGIPASPFRSFE
jgi:sialate O-acetylesterase